MEIPRRQTCRYACFAVIAFGLTADPLMALLVISVFLLMWAAS